MFQIVYILNSSKVCWYFMLYSFIITFINLKIIFKYWFKEIEFITDIVIFIIDIVIFSFYTLLILILFSQVGNSSLNIIL